MKFPPLVLFAFSVIIVISPLQCLNTAELSLLTMVKPLAFFYTKTFSTDIFPSEKYQSLKPTDKVRVLESKINELNSENTLLRNENASLINKLKSISDFKQISPSGITVKEHYNIILSEVIIKSDASTWRKSFTINRGYNDGLKNGFAVVSGKHLVGKVSDVGPSISRIRLITDPAFRTQVMILPPPESAITDTSSALPEDKQSTPKINNKNTTQEQICLGVLAGVSFNRSIIKWVSRELKISQEWDVFSAPDQSGITPSGLIIGKVDKISIDGYFYTLGVTPSIDFYNLSSVLVLAPKK